MLTYERYQALRAINIRVPGEPGNEATFLDLVSGRSSNWHSAHARVGGVQPLNLEANLEMALFGVSNFERRF